MTSAISFQEIITSSPVLFFSKDNCSYCVKLEEDLVNLKIPYKKVILEGDLREKLIEHTKNKAVPQLFIGGKFVGGYKEFATLCGTGKLDKLLEPFNIVVDLSF